MRNVWLFDIKIQFYIWLLFVEKLINNICFNNCLYLWDYGGYIIHRYEDIESTPDSWNFNNQGLNWSLLDH